MTADVPRIRALLNSEDNRQRKRGLRLYQTGRPFAGFHVMARGTATFGGRLLGTVTTVIIDQTPSQEN